VVGQAEDCARTAKRKLARAKRVRVVPIIMTDNGGARTLERRWLEVKVWEGGTPAIYTVGCSLLDPPTEAGAVSHLPHSRPQFAPASVDDEGNPAQSEAILAVDQSRPGRTHCRFAR
jgi:hypothetical protein